MHVCRVCGVPRRRIVDADRQTNGKRNQMNAARIGGSRMNTMAETTYTTLGWSDCGHDDYRRGHVLDPFAGSGTTLAAATEQGRDATGIDLDADNYWLARERIGMFLEEPA
jgi:16S rRNA G966 N2-methylase RsmD